MSVPINRIGLPTGLLNKKKCKEELQKILDLGINTLEVHSDWEEHLEEITLTIPSVSIHATGDNKDFIKHGMKLNIQRFILHPTEIDGDPLWTELEDKLLIENLDHPIPEWRTAQDLHKALKLVPNASICLDIAHTVKNGSIIAGFIPLRGKIKQVHFSEINHSTGEHFEEISEEGLAELIWIHHLHPSTPVILELQLHNPWEKTLKVINQLT